MRRYLVVANQTLGGGPLSTLLRELAEEPSTFHVLVPASPPVDHLWTEAEANAIARKRLDTALERDSFDAIVLSTLPPRLSKWLRLDLVHRVQTSFGLPVHHVISHRETVDV